MAAEINYNYDGKLKVNILIVGRTECGKTIFIQKLGEKNRMFGDIKEVVWVSKIPISKDREYNIRDCFVHEKTDFQHPNCIHEFVDLLDHFHRQKVP